MAGVWFDDMHVGQRFEHPIRRTVTETDNVLFTAMTHNPALLHLDEQVAVDVGGRRNGRGGDRRLGAGDGGAAGKREGGEKGDRAPFPNR